MPGQPMREARGSTVGGAFMEGSVSQDRIGSRVRADEALIRVAASYLSGRFGVGTAGREWPPAAIHATQLHFESPSLEQRRVKQIGCQETGIFDIKQLRASPCLQERAKKGGREILLFDALQVAPHERNVPSQLPCQARRSFGLRRGTAGKGLRSTDLCHAGTASRQGCQCGSLCNHCDEY